MRRGPLHHPLRFPAAVLLVIAGAVHIPVVPQHLQEAPYIGALFIALTAVCFGLALALPWYDNATLWAASGGVTVAAVLAYALPGLSPSHRSATTSATGPNPWDSPPSLPKPSPPLSPRQPSDGEDR